LLPEPKPRLKTNVTALDVRLDDIREGTAHIPGLEVIAVESDRFTVERTLPEVEALLGPARFTLLIGSDVARHVASWPEVEALLSRWQLAIGMRNDDTSEDIETMLYGIEQKHGISVKRTYVHTNKSTVSSSELRRKLK
jgi:nicotinic acid mononucleotide adenylyltransferase